MSTALRNMVVAGMSAIVMGGTMAQVERRPVEPASAAEPVFTRARVRSFLEEPGGKFYVRLKLLPRTKIPFSTQTFRVTDRALLTGIQEGAWVKFTSRHIDGENTVTSIQAVAECVRFQQCD